MIQLKRFIIMLVAFTLMPVSPALAKQTDQILWRGTVTVQQVHKAEWSNGILSGKLREVFTRKITALGTGSARQEVTYSKHFETGINCVGGGTDMYVVDSEGSVIYPPFTFSVGVNSTNVWIDFQEGGVQVTDYHNDNCQESSHIGQRTFNVTYSVLQHNGLFSSDSTEIYGFAEDPGNRKNFYDPNYAPAYAGWPGWESLSTFTVYNLIGSEMETHWFSQETKNALNQSVDVFTETAVTVGSAGVAAGKTGNESLATALEVAAATFGFASVVDKNLVWFDPPDPNYTEIYVPVIPIASQQPIVPNGDLTQEQADAFNALLNNLEQGIGLGRAILICFYRALGARLANDNYWINQQFQAARTYSGQYADALDARQQILDNLKQTLIIHPGIPIDITSKDIAQYKYDLIVNGFSAEQDQLLTELGMDQRDKAILFDNLILADVLQEPSLQDPIVRFPDLLTDPAFLQTIHSEANLLHQYAEGEGWTMFMPLMIR